jgi:prepilin-type N-terminal cleavage/methylation domain-containing protein
MFCNLRAKIKTTFSVIKSEKGFTLIELIVATMIFVYVATLSIMVLSQTLNTQRKINTKRVLQEDARYTLEKIVKEFRNGTIDYPAYYLLNHNIAEPFSADDYQTYTDLDPDASGGPSICYGGTCQATRTGPENYSEEELVIIDGSGKNRTRFKIGGTDLDGDGSADNIVMAKEIYQDDGTGTYAWVPAEGFTAAGQAYQTISPATFNVTNFKVYIYPIKDPNYFYDDPDIQSQPMITIMLDGQYYDNTKTIPTPLPTISLQTSVSARTYNKAVSWEKD